MKRTLMLTLIALLVIGTAVGVVVINAKNEGMIKPSGDAGERAPMHVDSPPVDEKVIKVTAKKFEFVPAEITVKKGEPVVIEIVSEDATHGFNLPDFGIRANIKRGGVSRVRFTPDKTGQFDFACDVFCGSGHEDMSGTLKVVQ